MADIKIYGKLKNSTESGKVADYADIDGAPEISQATGQSTEKTMSQKAITDAINAGGGTAYSVVEISTSQTVLTDEQYSVLTASPFNKIKFNNIIYNLYQETISNLVYTANLFNNGERITITKNTKAITRGSLDSLTSISSYVKNSLDYAQSNTTYALSAYQGKVLNDRLIALEDSGGGASSVPVVALTGTSGTITQAQWDILYNSEVAFVKYKDGYMYPKVYHSSELLTFAYFGGKTTKVFANGVIRIPKSGQWSWTETKIPTTAGCIISMQNNTSSQGSTDPFYGPIFIGPGLKLTNGILSLAVSSPETVYVHDIKLSTETCAADQIGQGAAVANVLEFAFYSSVGSFNNDPVALWFYIVRDNNWIPTINGTLYGTIGGDATVKAVTKETIEGTDYLCILIREGYGEITKYYVSIEDMTDPSKTQLVDAFREI